MTDTDHWHSPSKANQRQVMQSMIRGFVGTCPNCGTGHIFEKYAKVAHSCDHCGEELHHHRADDLPAYIVITIVGKIVVAGFITIAMNFEWSTWQHLALWAPITILLAIYLLPKVKGAIVGIQWALKMHGFGSYPDYQDQVTDYHDQITDAQSE